MWPNAKQVEQIIKPIADHYLSDLGKVVREIKSDGSFVTVIDQQLQTEISAALKQEWPQIALLGEEMSRDQQAQMLAKTQDSNHGLWVLDPLDGTTNFSSGLPLFGVSIALVVAGESQVAVVYDPNRKESFLAEKGKGAWLNQQRLVASTVTEIKECIANVDYKRLTHDLAQQLVVCPPYRSQRNMGTCVLEWCWLACDRIQLYLHGGQQLWDHAAGHLILQEAGGMARGLRGDEMNSAGLCKQSTVAAASPYLFELWRDWIGLQTR